MTEVRRIGVLGAGTMGAGIAQVAAEAGLEVRVLDPVDGAYDRARDRIGGFLERRVAKGQLHAGAADAALARISEAGSVADLAATDLVVEAIPEDPELKRDAFRRLDAAAAPATILATNTSSLSVRALAEATTRPGRVVGMHFFNPVPLMALVEVIAAPRTDAAVVADTVELARRLGKTPVEAADTPGFIVNRVARPFYLEALRIVGEGVATVPEVDAALRDAGFRMGPFELIDTIGADVNLAVSESVWEGFGRSPRYLPHALQRILVQAGRLGRKTGAGFYDYDADGERGEAWSGFDLASGGAASPAGAAASPTGAPAVSPTVADRVLAAIVNEAASAVEDGTATPEAIDVAMRLGTNWPHGPLAWGRDLGLSRVVAILDALAARAPDARYAVVPLLRSAAERGESLLG